MTPKPKKKFVPATFNKFMDTSAASGFQNRGTAQYTSLLKGQIVDPVKAQQQGLLATIKLRNKKKYQEALAERARMGGGTSAASDTPVPTMSTNTQEIL